MVLFYSSNVVEGQPPITIYAGIDKFENEDLIKYSLPTDVWFHVDKLSSPHIYLRIPTISPDPNSEEPFAPPTPLFTLNDIPTSLVEDCSQLVKAGSIEGNKKDNVGIIYTYAKNLRKSGDMAVGQVAFHDDKAVKRHRVITRQNPIVNRLQKTKTVREVDHEVERQERQREEGKRKKAEALDKKNKEVAMKKEHQAKAEARSYDSVFASAGTIGTDQDEEDEEKVEGFDDDDFI